MTTTVSADDSSRCSIKKSINESANVLLAVLDVFFWIARERYSPITLQKRGVVRHYELLVVLAQCATKLRVGDRECLLDAMDVLHFTIKTLQKTSINYQ